MPIITSTIASTIRKVAPLTLLGVATLLSACQRAKIPEADSYSAQLYVKRCGECHTAYNPHEMTAAMWAVKVEAMQALMAKAGVPPLSPDERKAILDYLTRNAGNE